MSWFSILPESISFVETWAIRVFVLLGILVMGPWLLILFYDAVLYIFRTITYDIPYIGGRARNRPRPRAPSLGERLSLIVPAVSTTPDVVEDTLDAGLRKRLEIPCHGINGMNDMADD